MAHAAIVTRTYPVGRYWVTFTKAPTKPGNVGVLTAEWEPDVPQSMDDAEAAEYRAAWNAFGAEVEQITGQRFFRVEA